MSPRKLFFLKKEFQFSLAAGQIVLNISNTHQESLGVNQSSIFCDLWSYIQLINLGTHGVQIKTERFKIYQNSSAGLQWIWISVPEWSLALSLSRNEQDIASVITSSVSLRMLCIAFLAVAAIACTLKRLEGDYGNVSANSKPISRISCSWTFQLHLPLSGWHHGLWLKTVLWQQLQL